MSIKSAQGSKSWDEEKEQLLAKITIHSATIKYCRTEIASVNYANTIHKENCTSIRYTNRHYNNDVAIRKKDKEVERRSFSHISASSLATHNS